MKKVTIVLNTGEAWSTTVEDEAKDMFVDSVEGTLTINTFVGGVFKAPLRSVSYWVHSDEE